MGSFNRAEYWRYTVMNRLAEEQRRRNALARDAWAAYASHRDAVTNLLLAEANGSAPALCVLGAGNCNDLDLPRLANRFGRIHLCDLDEESLWLGLAAQGVAGPGGPPPNAGGERTRTVRDGCWQIHGGVDLSGIGDRLSAWSPASPPTADEIGRLTELAGRVVPWSLEPPADVVASVCLLSQLIDALVQTVGESHAGFIPLMVALRRRHLELLLELVRPGGSLVLVTDFVSSVTCPELGAIAEAGLADLSLRLIRQRNFFTGLNPLALRQVFAAEPSLASRVRHVRLCRPWLWHYPARTYAVTAITARRAAPSGEAPLSVPPGRDFQRRRSKSDRR